MTDASGSTVAVLGRRRPLLTRIAVVAIGIWAFALLSVGLTRDWQLRNEDNGAMHTTRALSHLRTGLAHTRAHGMFVDRFTGQTRPYGHHPPGPAGIVTSAA